MTAALQEWMRFEWEEEQSNKIIPFNDFVCRFYQQELFRVLRQKLFKHYVIVAHRDFGKDILVFNHVLYEMYLVPGAYHYVFQTLDAAKNTIWEGISHDGRPLLDYVPPELIIKLNRNEQFIKLRTKCGKVSTLRFIGSENYNNKRGPKVEGVVFSESAYCHPEILEVYKPVIRTHQRCWEIHISTPNGQDNHFYDLYEMSKHNPDWYCGFFPIDVTKMLSEEDMEKERARGTSEEKIRQEYYCDFTRGTEGSFYAKYLQEAKLSGRIGNYGWDSSRPVYTAWDLGLRNNRIIFFQLKENGIYIIDTCDDSEGGLEQRVKHIMSKPYTVAMNHIPHDGESPESRKGQSIKDLLEELGLKVKANKRNSPLERIEKCRANFSRIYFNKNCHKFLSDISSYHQVFDKRRNCYLGIPAKNGPDHYADAFGLLVIVAREIESSQIDYDYKKIDEAYYQYHYGEEYAPSASLSSVGF